MISCQIEILRDGMVRIDEKYGMDMAISSISVAFTCSKAIKELISSKTICQALTSTLLTLKNNTYQEERVNASVGGNFQNPSHQARQTRVRARSATDDRAYYETPFVCGRMVSGTSGVFGTPCQSGIVQKLLNTKCV